MNKLRQTIIDNQDYIIYVSYLYYNEDYHLKENIEKYALENNIDFDNIIDLIINDDEILNHINTNNLSVLNAKAILNGNNDDNINKLTRILIERYRHGENIFGGYNLDINLGMNMYQNSLILNNFSKTVPNIKNGIEEDILAYMESLKELECYNLFNDVNIDIKANFINFYKKNGLTANKIKTLKKIKEINKNLLNIFNYNLLEDEIYSLGEDIIIKIGRFPNLSAKLIILKNNRMDLFKIIKDEINNIDNMFAKDEIFIRLLNYFFENYPMINNYNKKELVEVALNSNQKFNLGIKNNIEKDIVCDELFNNRDNSLDELKDFYFIKYFSKTLDDVKEFMKCYAKNYNQVKQYNTNPNIDKFLLHIETILKINKKEKIEKLYYNSLPTSPKYWLIIEGELKEIYAKSYIERIKNLEGRIKYNIQNETNFVKKERYQGKEVTCIDMEGNFDLFVHSSNTGFMDDKIIDTSYKEEWINRNDTNNHIISATYINQDNLGTAPIVGSGVLYGFTNVNKIMSMGISDINSHIMQFGYSSGGTQQYVSATSMPYQTRRVYNEFSIEREGIKPDYIVLFSDADNNIVNNAYKAALDFNIPILKINKKKIIKQHIVNLETLLEIYNNSKGIELVEEIIETFEANISGLLVNDSLDEVMDNRIINKANEEEISIYKSLKNEIEKVIYDYINSTESNQIELANFKNFLLQQQSIYNNVNDLNIPISTTNSLINYNQIISYIDEMIYNKKRAVS